MTSPRKRSGNSDGSNVLTPDQFVDHINAALNKSVEGMIEAGRWLLQAKADWTEETIVMIERRIAAGAPDAAIVRELFGGESVPGYISGGDYSRTNFVRAVRRGMEAK